MIRAVALAAALSLVGGACANGTDDGGPTTAQDGQLVAQVASYDLAADRELRFIVGLLTDRNELVSGGTVDMEFFFLGEERAEGDPELVHRATAGFLTLPGSEPPRTDRATVGPPSEGRGVYEVPSITFDRPGLWEVAVRADLGDGDVRTGTAAFVVLEEPRVPAPGEEAIPTENLTADSDAPAPAVDSRAQRGGEVPDEILHRTTIAEVLEGGRPAVVVFSTPVYCVSRFCGPITDMVEELARDHRDRAAFIHVEIWRDFQEQVVNRAAAEWLLRDGDLQEPWVFAIGTEGVIEERWDNVATRGEIEAWLQQLP